MRASALLLCRWQALYPGFDFLLQAHPQWGGVGTGDRVRHGLMATGGRVSCLLKSLTPAMRPSSLALALAVGAVADAGSSRGDGDWLINRRRWPMQRTRVRLLPTARIATSRVAGMAPRVGAR